MLIFNTSLNKSNIFVLDLNDKLISLKMSQLNIIQSEFLECTLISKAKINNQPENFIKNMSFINNLISSSNLVLLD